MSVPRPATVLATVLAIVVAGVLVLAGFAVVPLILRAAATHVAESDTSIDLGVDGGGPQASVPVDADWSYAVDPSDASRATLRSPNGALTIDVRVLRADDIEQAIRDEADAAVTPLDTEPVGSETVLHGWIVGEDALVGAVGQGDAALVFTARPGAGYEADLAGLLSRIEVTP